MTAERSVMQPVLSISDASREFVNDIAFLPPIGIVFAFISKNASSLLKTYFASLEVGRLRNPPTWNPHYRQRTGFLGVDDLGPQEMDRLLVDPNVPKVVVGRDPLSRLLSAWKSRIRTWHLESYQSSTELTDWVAIRQAVLGHALQSHAAPARQTLTADISFEMLVDYVEQTPSSQLDRHLAPQVSLCGAQEIPFNLVGQVEHLDSFLTRLADLIDRDLPRIGDFRLNVTPSSPRDSEAISQDLRRRVRQRFKVDYEFFGYSLTDVGRT